MCFAALAWCSSSGVRAPWLRAAPARARGVCGRGGRSGTPSAPSVFVCSRTCKERERGREGEGDKQREREKTTRDECYTHTTSVLKCGGVYSKSRRADERPRLILLILYCMFANTILINLKYLTGGVYRSISNLPKLLSIYLKNSKK